jgi:hypothetical protein
VFIEERTMMYLIAIALLVGYAFLLLYGLLRLARELIAKPHPPPVLYSDPETDQDDESRREQQSPSAAQDATCAIDVLRHSRESP